MQHLNISAKKRETLGKKSTIALRNEDGVPCVIYGGGDNIHCSVKRTDLKQLIYTPKSYIVVLDIEGHSETVVMRDIQYHPVTDEPIHVDFYRVIDGKAIEIDLPIETFGNAEGIKVGGKLFIAKRKLRVSALEKNLPDAIRVDITKMLLNQSVFVGEIKVENVTILTPATTVICSVKMTRAARGAAAAAASSGADDDKVAESSEENSEE